MIIPVTQFAPDADRTQAGVVKSLTMMVPTSVGYKAAPTPTDPGFNALANEAFGAVVARKLDNSTRVIAGAAQYLYELSSGTWSDVSGSTYGASADVRWCFTQFGDVTIAANKNNTIQSSSSGAFANITGAPKAKLVDTAGQFVIAADTNDVTFGDSPDRWWCCAAGDYTDWTPDITTLCVSGRLTSAPGRITALKRLGDGIVAYKDRAIFMGSYVGAPEVWNFQEIPGQIGCPSQAALVDIGSAHVFMGYDNFYLFDGSRPTPIGNDVKNWFLSNLYTSMAFRVQALHDRTRSLVYWFYPSKSGGGVLDSAIVYNYLNNKWGIADQSITCVLDFISSGLAMDSTFATGTTYSTYISTITTYDSPALVAGSPIPAYIDTSHKVQYLTGNGDTWGLTLGDIGDDANFTTLKRVRPRFLRKPTSATLQHRYMNNEGDDATTGTQVTLTNGKFDILQSARWHSLEINGEGGCELNAIDVQLSGAGKE